MIYMDLNVFVNIFDVFPSRVRVCGAACGPSPTSEKHAPGFLEHVPYVFYSFALIFCIFVCLFCGFRVSQQGACVLRCLRRFRTLRKNTPMEI